jgi:hypothetical protein
VIRLFTAVALLMCLSAYVTLALVDRATANDIGIIYAATVGTVSLALHLGEHSRD